MKMLPFTYLLNKIICIFMVCIFLMCCTKQVRGQNTDSLKRVLSSSKLADTARVSLMLKIAEITKDVKPDSSIKIANEGLQLAERINFEEGKVKCLLILGKAYYTKQIMAKALEYYKEAQKISEDKHYSIYLSQALFGCGIVYDLKGKGDSSLDYLKQAIQLSEKINDYNGIAKAALRMGDQYYLERRYEDGLKNYFIALKNFEQTGNKVKESATCAAIATLYSGIKDAKNSKAYIGRSLALLDNSTPATDRMTIYSDLGAAYGNLDDYTNAIALLKQNYRLADSMHLLFFKNVSLFNIATAEISSGSPEAAIRSYDQLLSDKDNVYDSSFITVVIRNKYSVQFSLHQYKEAIIGAKIAFDYEWRHGQKSLISRTAKDIAGGYTSLGDYKNALKYHTIYADYKDSAVNEDNNISVQQLQFDYDLAKKQAQIELLNKTKQIEKEKIARQRILLAGSVFGLVSFLLIILLMVRNRQVEQRNNKLLFKQKEEIQEQAVKLQELNEFKDKTFSVLSHDLRGPLASFSMTMSLIDNNYMTIEEFNEIRPELNERLISVNSLMDNLLQWSENYMKGNAIAMPEMVELRSVTEVNLRLVNHTATTKGIAVINTIADTILAWCDVAQADIVIRNLMTNALKFTNAGGSITISAEEKGDLITVSVADTGVGMTDEQVKKLFIPAANNHTYGTEGERGTGLGLLLCYEFVTANGGEIWATSKPGEGTTFLFTVPKFKEV